MKKKIIILGSTGSIGKNTINVISKNKNFQIKLLSTNKNISLLMKQAKKFNVKHLIITDFLKYRFAKKKYNNSSKKFYNDFDIINNIFTKKEIFYSMIAVVGIDGLKPTIDLIKYSQNIAIVNKESLICGWEIIKDKLTKHNTKFIPIDSEHFSLNDLISVKNKKLIKKIYITASGGPFLNYSKTKMRDISLKESLNHPNWSMGKKISIDSATMMNKVFEVIEAKNIFDISYKKIDILTHPKSYIHAIVEFKNGIIKFVAHEPDMRIPISNSMSLDYHNKSFFFKSMNFGILNNLHLKKIDTRQFPLVKILKDMPKINSLYETALVTINDFYVHKYLEKKIDFLSLINLIYKCATNKEILKYRSIRVRNLAQIYQVKEIVKLKLINNQI